jgi:phage I-like protein
MQTVRHFLCLPSTESNEPPEWVQLLPAGVFHGIDGRGPWTVKNSAALIAASMADGKFPIDENHSTDLASPLGLPAPAVGWVVEMQARQDGTIWGRVDWSPDGAELMRQKKYRGLSPVFPPPGADGAIQQVLRAGLTNTPNLSTLNPLNRIQETSVDLKALRAALGLSDTADEAAILNAVQALSAASATHATQLAAVATAAGLTITTKGVDVPAIVAELNAARATAGNPLQMTARIGALEAELNTVRQGSIALETELNTLKAAGKLQAATAFVDAAITAGKPIAALRNHYIARHQADPAGVEVELNALVSINAGGLGGKLPPPSLNDEDEPTDDEMNVAKKMGQDPKKLVEARKARMAAEANTKKK